LLFNRAEAKSKPNLWNPSLSSRPISLLANSQFHQGDTF